MSSRPTAPLRRRVWSTLGLLLACALLLLLSFPPADLGFLAWVGLVPLMVALRGRGPGEAFRLSLFCGAVFYLGLLWWVLQLAVYSPWAALGLLLLCLYLGAYVGLWGAVWASLPPARRIWAAPAAWVGLELVRFHLLSGFPWGALGYSQYRALPLLQTARAGGVHALTFLIVLVATGLAQAVLRARTAKRDLAIAAVAVAVCLAYGLFALGQALQDLDDGDDAITVALVQGNVPMDVKWDDQTVFDILERHVAFSREAAGADIVVWSETALPTLLPDVVITPMVESTAAELGVWILTGGMSAGRGDLLRNSVFAFSPEAGLCPEVYSKRRLVPFGELIPPWLPLWLRDALPPVGNFEAGTSAEPLPTPGAPVGVLICYESIFPDLARKSCLAGATWLCNVTNDAWFGRTAAAEQHAAMAVFRAVETGRPLARCANTGVTMTVDRWGRRRVCRSQEGELTFFNGVLRAPIIPCSSPTPALVLGEWPAAASLAVALCALLVGRKLDAGAAGGHNTRGE